MDKMKKALMIVAIVAIVVIAASMLYYFVFVKTEKERAEIKIQEQKLELEKEKQQDEKQQKIIKEVQLNTCLQQARDNYEADWAAACKALGEPEDGSLPGYLADPINQHYKDARDECIKLYGE